MRMRMRASLLAALVAAAGCGSAEPGRAVEQPPLPRAGDVLTTTVVVVRHAEKADDDPRDPSLSPAGRARAEALADALADAGVDAVLATQFRRTRDTGAVLAGRLGVPVETVEVGGGGVEAHVAAIADRIRTRHAGQTVLVVGHSNTVPAIVAGLGAPQPAPLTDEDYDDLFIVTVPPAGPAGVVRARYGAAT